MLCALLHESKISDAQWIFKKEIHKWIQWWHNMLQIARSPVALCQLSIVNRTRPFLFRFSIILFISLIFLLFKINNLHKFILIIKSNDFAVDVRILKCLKACNKRDNCVAYQNCYKLWYVSLHSVVSKLPNQKFIIEKLKVLKQINTDVFFLLSIVHRCNHFRRLDSTMTIFSSIFLSNSFYWRHQTRLFSVISTQNGNFLSLCCLRKHQSYRVENILTIVLLLRQVTTKILRKYLIFSLKMNKMNRCITKVYI